MQRLLFVTLTTFFCALVYSGCQSPENFDEAGFGPVITQITPTRGAPESTVEVLGTGFGPLVGALRFYDTKMKPTNAPILDWSDTRIKALVPALPTGPQTAVVDVQSSAFADSAFRVEYTILKKP